MVDPPRFLVTEIRARWNELKSVTETFVHCCEQGNFDALRQNLAKTVAAK